MPADTFTPSLKNFELKSLEENTTFYIYKQTTIELRYKRVSANTIKLCILEKAFSLKTSFQRGFSHEIW